MLSRLVHLYQPRVDTGGLAWDHVHQGPLKNRNPYSIVNAFRYSLVLGGLY
eukprot:COSAG01_NODE_54114_length_334_cov_0.880851_1_plen_50_part_10